MQGKGVLIVSLFFRPNIGGIETHLTDLLKELSERQVNTFVVTFQPLTGTAKSRTFDKENSARIYRLPNPLFNFYYRLDRHALMRYLILSPLLFAGSMAVMIKHRKSIQVMHGHNYVAAPVVAILSKIFSTRSVITIYDTHDYFTGGKGPVGYVAKVILSSFRSVIAISNKGKEEIETLGIDSERVSVMTFWIDLDAFKPDETRGGKFTFSKIGNPAFLFVGRLTESKGAGLMLQVAKQLKRDSGIQISFIGQGPLESEIRKCSNKNGTVLYLGAFRSEELRHFYNRADATVFPSIHEEGYGRVIMESLACGTPVLASRRGAITEVIDQSVGILFEPEVNELLQTIESVSREVSILKELAENCREYALRRFGKHNVDTVIKAYAFGNP